MADFGKELRAKLRGRPNEVADRASLAQKRLLNVLENRILCNQRTLEMKISEAGPHNQRVDPQILAWALKDLVDRHRVKGHRHPDYLQAQYFAPARKSDDEIGPILDRIAPLYYHVTHYPFSKVLGDALEIPVYKLLNEQFRKNRTYIYQGAFQLQAEPDQNGQYPPIKAPNTLGNRQTNKEPDFLHFNPEAGPFSIECKNHREWLYPPHGLWHQAVRTALDLGTTPIIVARKFHYTTRKNLFEPAGIIALETHHQIYPPHEQELAQQVSALDGLGFHDVKATSDPTPRMQRFFDTDLPKIAEHMAERFDSARDALEEYFEDENLARLYTNIGSPAGGNWVDPEDNEYDW